MTTVVFDGQALACDTRRNDGDRFDPFDNRPKVHIRNGVVFAGAGLESWVLNFVEWYGTGQPYPMTSDQGDGAAEVCVFERGKWRRYQNDSTFPDLMPDKWAIGTGSTAALAAMLCKRNAPQAVAVACQIDNNSGGSIFTANLSELISKGATALRKYRNGVQADRKSARPASALQRRKGGRNSRSV